MLTISCAGCLGLSPVILAQVTLKICVTTWNHEKFTENPIFEVQGRSKFIDVGTPGKLVSSSYCYDNQQTCLSATVRTLVNSGKITTSYGGRLPIFDATYKLNVYMIILSLRPVVYNLWPRVTSRFYPREKRQNTIYTLHIIHGLS